MFSIEQTIIFFNKMENNLVSYHSSGVDAIHMSCRIVRVAHYSILLRHCSLAFLLMISGCSTNEPRVFNRNPTWRFEPSRFSLTEIMSRTWQQEGHNVKLLRQFDLPTSDAQRPNCKAMVFGFSNSGAALCIEFYAYNTLYVDGRQYCLMERDWLCPPIDTSVTWERQNGRVLINVDGDSATEGAVFHHRYAYELMAGFRLERMMSEFKWEKHQP